MPKHLSLTSKRTLTSPSPFSAAEGSPHSISHQPSSADGSGSAQDAVKRLPQVKTVPSDPRQISVSSNCGLSSRSPFVSAMQGAAACASSTRSAA